MTSRRTRRRRLSWALAILLVVAAVGYVVVPRFFRWRPGPRAHLAEGQANTRSSDPVRDWREAVSPRGGFLHTVNGYPVLELAGTPEEMGEAHGRLLGERIKRVIKDVLRPETDPARYKRIMAGARVMDRFQPEPYRREMRALAQAAGVDYMDVVALQLFGDAERGYTPGMSGVRDGGAETTKHTKGTKDTENAARGMSGSVSLAFSALSASSAVRHNDYQCTNFAVFGPATATGECIVGRNFDYWYESVSRYASLIIHYRPDEGHAFVTITWAGVINGWTLMNEKGLVAANNNAYSTKESCEGISTCFLQRHIIQTAATVEKGIEIARAGPRAVGTVMLVAGGDPPDAVELEFDHEAIAVRRAERGWVAAENGFITLHSEGWRPESLKGGRYNTLERLIEANHGRIDRTMNFAAADGVPLSGINLHCALMFPEDLTFAVSMGKVPACRGPFRRFRMTPEGIVPAK